MVRLFALIVPVLLSACASQQRPPAAVGNAPPTRQAEPAEPPDPAIRPLSQEEEEL